MKLALGLSTLLAAAAALYLAAAHFSGGAFPTLGLPLGGDRAQLRRIALSFMEDIQYKDFAQAASYHAPEVQDEVDIPYLIQKLFVVKPEALDLMDFEVVFAKIDGSGDRARIKLRVKAKPADGKVREQEFLLYFKRTSGSAPWYMELEDSLRNPEASRGKKS